jgi:hypothetical protein
MRFLSGAIRLASSLLIGKDHTMQTWHHALKRAIGEQCTQAYRQANIKSDGTMRRKHVPYPVPELARAMVNALDRDDEHEAKRLLLIYRTGALSLV